MQLARLARTGWGIPLSQCLQLIASLIHSRTDYAASVWHQQGKSTAAVKAIQRIDNAAQRFALEVFKTHPLVFLKHDTASPSALHRLDARAQKSTARLLSLPGSNPAAMLARTALATPRKAHRACLHHTLHHPSSVISTLLAPIEIISPTQSPIPFPNPRVRSLIARTKEAAAHFVTSQLEGPVGKDPTRSLSFSDGSLIPDVGVAAAALHLPTGILSPANLGDPTHHTVYEAELVGIRMAANMAFSHRTRLQDSHWFFIDNQPSIRALTQPLRPSPGLMLRQRAVNSFAKLINLSPTASVTLVWCPAHVGIHENEEVDEAAKAATTAGAPQNLPLSLAAVKQQINSRCAASVSDKPPPAVLRRLRGVYHPASAKKALAGLPRGAATAVAQLRAGHTPLAAFLHRINAVDDPNCAECAQPETTEHFLLLCRKYSAQRADLVKQVRLLHLPCTTQTLLTNPKAFKPLADYVQATDRFRLPRQWRPPTTQATTQHTARSQPTALTPPNPTPNPPP